MGIPFARVRAVPKIWAQLLSCFFNIDFLTNIDNLYRNTIKWEC